jgi:hypothetical protein
MISRQRVEASSTIVRRMVHWTCTIRANIATGSCWGGCGGRCWRVRVGVESG